MKQIMHWMTLMFFFIGLHAATGYAAETLLRDGFHLQAVDGSLILETKTDAWFFQSKTDLFDGKHTVGHQTRFALLPTSVLESLILDQQKRATLEYRLWAKVTQYQGKNYLYVTRFLPLRKAVLTPAEKPSADQIKPKRTTAPDTLGIPEAIERDRRTRRLVDRPTAEVAQPSQPDALMLDRVGYLTSQGDTSVFVLDGLGRTVNSRHLALLPNRLLDTLQQQQAAALGRLHFRIVGLITVYQGQEYLLLQRTARVYNYGNFGK